jgi:NhaA family Na+:H+ antiporter
VPLPDPVKAREADERAEARVQADVKGAQASHALVTPTFFINGRRYDDPWDESSFADAMLGSPGHRLRGVALDFADWAPSAGILLLLATILAVVLTNSGLGPPSRPLWELYLGVSLGSAEFKMPLLHWINDGLLMIFFRVVGLEIKREFTVGRLAIVRSGALPVAAAIGGMVVPVIVYLLLIPAGAWSHGWGFRRQPIRRSPWR